MYKIFTKPTFIPRACTGVRQHCASFTVYCDPGHNSKQLLHAPHKVRTSWLKSVVRDVLPFTAQTISARGQSVDNLEIAASYCIPSPATTETTTTESTKKRTDDSWLELHLPFSEHPSLRETMSKSDGVNMRYGKLFELLDAFAADVAYRHFGHDESSKVAIVTAGVDSMKVNDDISLMNDLKFQGYLTFVGRSSMEVTIDLISVTPQGEEQLVGNTEFIMVARNATGAARVPGLLLANELAETAFAAGQQNVERRKQKAASDLSIKPPLPHEMNLIHGLFLQSKRIQSINEYAHIDDAASSSSKSAKSIGALDTKSMPPALFNTPELHAVDQLIQQGRYQWMKTTCFKNTQFMHMQNRNIHGKIFGGFIMRIAFELAAVCAACFVGDKNAMFEYVDEIQFEKPVNIGSIVEFSSTIIYNRGNQFVIQVIAEDVSPINTTRTRTNMLTFVFRTPEEVGNTLPVVLPSTYGEILSYLEGKRSLDLLEEGEKRYQDYCKRKS